MTQDSASSEAAIATPDAPLLVVEDVATHFDTDRGLVRAVDGVSFTLARGKTLGLETLAEGIEDQMQYAQLQLEECDSGQGFLMARPLDADVIADFLDTHAAGLGKVAPAISLSAPSV